MLYSGIAASDTPKGNYTVEFAEREATYLAGGKQARSCGAVSAKIFHELKLIEIRFSEAVEVNGSKWEFEPKTSSKKKVVVTHDRGDGIVLFLGFWRERNSRVAESRLVVWGTDSQGVCADGARLVGYFTNL